MAGIMIQGNTVASELPMTERRHEKGEQERDRLVHAIESAIEVGRPDQFHAWLRGPFRTLLPHESVVCMELDECGAARQIACLHHKLIDAAAMDVLGNAEHGLALRLARLYRGNRRQSSMVDANALSALLEADGAPVDRGLLHNAFIHRVKLLSGATYCVVLANVSEDSDDRHRHLFKLLSSHLKMALSRAIATREPDQEAALTQREREIVQWMSKGKSNREIGVILGISAITLKKHVNKLYRKLDVQNRADAVRRGLASSVPEDDGHTG